MKSMSADNTGAAFSAEQLDPTYWERVATTRWGTYTSAVEKRIILQGQRLHRTPGRMIEIGCEGGRWCKMLADLGWQPTCVDVAPQMLAKCQRVIPTARCLLVKPCDTTIPCADGAFDFLLCMEVAPVIQSEWFLAEAHRVLSERGVLVGMFWNSFSWRGFAYRLRGLVSGTTARDYYQRSYTGWRREARKLFGIVHEEGFCWGPLGRGSNSIWVPFFTRGERLLGLHRLVVFSPWVAFIARKNG